MQEILKISNFKVRPELIALGEEISKFQNHFYQVGIKEMLIIGGAARSILDSFFYNEDFTIRDLDTAFIIGHEASENEIEKLASDAQDSGLGINISPKLRKKNWAHPDDSPELWGKKNFGYGFHLRTNNIPIVSLSFYFSPKALDALGLFTFDTTMIRIPHFQNLVEALESGNSILDHRDGYTNWRLRQPVFFKYSELVRDPLKASFRIIRSYAKFNSLTINHSLMQDLKRAVASASRDDVDEFEFVRSILKSFNDKNCTWEMEQLSDVGALDFFPAIKLKVQANTFLPWVKETYPFLDIYNP